MTRIVRTQIAPNIYEINLLKEGSRHVYLGFNVIELDEGRTLEISRFLARDGSDPPSVRWFRAFALEYFPKAEVVTGRRMDKEGELRSWSYRFRQPPIASEPRVFLENPEVWRWAAVISLALILSLAGGFLLWQGLVSLSEAASSVNWTSFFRKVSL